MQRSERRTNLILIVSSLILAIGIGLLMPLAMGDRPQMIDGGGWTPPPATPIGPPTTTNHTAQLLVETAVRPATTTVTPAPAPEVTATDRPTEFVPSASAVSSVTPSPAPLPTLTPTAVATLRIITTVTAKPSPSPTPMVTAVPTPTIKPLPSPVPTQILPELEPSVTATAIPSVGAQPQAATLLPPTLEAPATGTETNAPITFAWDAAQPLPPGAAYEVVAWEIGQAPISARGLAAPTTETSLRIDLAVPYSLGVFKTADLSWTVLIVQTSPYQRLTLPDNSPARTLSYTSAPKP